MHRTGSKRRFAALTAAVALASGPGLAAAQGGKSPDAQREMAQRASNKTVAVAFMKAVAATDFEAARQHVGEYYIEHDPEREDGVPGLRKSLESERKRATRKEVTPQLVVADGDFVVTYSSILPLREAPPPPPGQAGPPGGAGRNGPPPPKPYLASEIFRLKDGKVVEHWITIQP